MTSNSHFLLVICLFAFFSYSLQEDYNECHIYYGTLEVPSGTNDVLGKEPKMYNISVRCITDALNQLSDDVCTNVDCGEGKCVPDPLIPLLFSCECNPGWKTIQIGAMPFGTCIIPNCTVDFSCGGKNPPTPPSPPINFTSPCNLVWCGDGDCVVNGTGHYCQCHERAANLFNNPQFLCMQQCYLDGDCKHVGLGPPPPPPPSSVASPGGGKSDASYSLTKLQVVLVVVFTTIFL